jgi:hypothetical protein
MRTIHGRFSFQDPESIDNAWRKRGNANTDDKTALVNCRTSFPSRSAVLTLPQSICPDDNGSIASLKERGALGSVMQSQIE